MDISADIDYQIEKMVLEINSQLINSELKDSNLSNIDIQSTDHESINIIKNILENRSDLLSINLDLNARKADIHFTSDAIRELNKNTHQFNLSKRDFENNIKLNDQKILEFKNKIKTLKNEIETLKRTNSDVAELYRKSQEELKDSKNQIQNNLNDANHYKDMYYSEHSNNYSQSVKIDELEVQLKNYKTMLDSQRIEINQLKNSTDYLKLKDLEVQISNYEVMLNSQRKEIECLKNNSNTIKDDDNVAETLKSQSKNIEDYTKFYNNLGRFYFRNKSRPKFNAYWKYFTDEEIILKILKNLEIRIKYNADFQLTKLTSELKDNLRIENSYSFTPLYEIFNFDNSKIYEFIEDVIIDFFIEHKPKVQIIKTYNLNEKFKKLPRRSISTTTYSEATASSVIGVLLVFVRIMYIYYLPEKRRERYMKEFSN